MNLSKYEINDLRDEYSDSLKLVQNKELEATVVGKDNLNTEVKIQVSKGKITATKGGRKILLNELEFRTPNEGTPYPKIKEIIDYLKSSKDTTIIYLLICSAKDATDLASILNKHTVYKWKVPNHTSESLAGNLLRKIYT